MTDPNQPQPSPTGPVKMTLQAAVDQQTAKLAPQYVAGFKAMMEKTHGALLAHPETVLVCVDKLESAAYRALLDAAGFRHIGIRIEAPRPQQQSLKKKIINHPGPPRRR